MTTADFPAWTSASTPTCGAYAPPPLRPSTNLKRSSAAGWRITYWLNKTMALSCKTPANIERELRMHLLVHNLVRRLMVEAARQRHASLSRISIRRRAALRRSAPSLPSKRKRNDLYEQLIRVLAEDQVPDRPGRREPRAMKRRSKPYPLLTKHRKAFKEIRYQSSYRADCHRATKKRSRDPRA